MKYFLLIIFNFVKCFFFGPDDIRDTNSHSVTDIKTEIGISVVLAIVDAVVVEED